MVKKEQKTQSKKNPRAEKMGKEVENPAQEIIGSMKREMYESHSLVSGFVSILFGAAVVATITNATLSTLGELFSQVRPIRKRKKKSPSKS
jgi:hypothetical protein